MKRLLLIGLLLAPLVSCGVPSRPELAGVQSSPAAPVLSSANTRVVTRAFFGHVYTLVFLRWSHPDPRWITTYEVWQATNEPYFEPGNCARCWLVGTTRAQWLLSQPTGLTFNPNGGTANATIAGSVITYKVRALNRVGVSPLSNEIGVMTFSLGQNMPYPFP